MGITDITPESVRCSFGSCPGLHDIAPPEAACSIGISCPALFEVPGYEAGGVAVIGKVSPEVTEMLKHRIGSDEAVVVIPRAMYEAIRNQGPIAPA